MSGYCRWYAKNLRDVREWEKDACGRNCDCCEDLIVGNREEEEEGEEEDE